MNDINIILITHTDLDGVFCAALANLAYPDPNYRKTIYYCGYDNVNEKVKDVIDELDKLSGLTMVFITDISVNEKTAELIDSANKQKVFGENVVSFWMFDHHGNEQTLALNKYCWAKVETNMPNSEKKTSGTRMFFDALKDAELQLELTDERLVKLEQYVELVRKYDTWEWAAANDEVPNKFNTLFKLYPRKLFVEFFGIPSRYDSKVLFEPTEELIISLDEEKKKSYINSKLKEVCMLTISGKCAGVVMAEQYINDVAHAITEKFLQCDLSVVVTSKTLSFRTDRDDVNVALIAQEFGGNGHPKAAGAQISEDVRLDMLSDIIFMTLHEDKE